MNDPELVALLRDRDRLRVEVGQINKQKDPNQAVLAEKRLQLADIIRRLAAYWANHT